MLEVIASTTMELQPEDREGDCIDTRIDDPHIVYVSIPYDLKAHSAVNTRVSPTFAHTTVEHSGAPISNLSLDLCEALVRMELSTVCDNSVDCGCAYHTNYKGHDKFDGSFDINKLVLPKHRCVFHSFLGHLLTICILLVHHASCCW